MIVMAASYEPFVDTIDTAPVPAEWFIERVPSDSRLASHIERKNDT